ncbi:hypothetical protein ACIHDR_48690 [Nocardia sp. NPDC052278]|uniref:hypothetical protein n=1 Tax=unclassified Nocardia TaxID=2637762 RepID=UPI0036A945A2
MFLVESAGIHHLRLTVTDVDHSCVFYQNLQAFAGAVQSEGPVDPVRTDSPRLYDGVVFETDGMLFELHPVASVINWFGSERVGLDDFRFSVRLNDESSLMAELWMTPTSPKAKSQNSIDSVSRSCRSATHSELTAPLT